MNTPDTAAEQSDAFCLRRVLKRGCRHDGGCGVGWGCHMLRQTSRRFIETASYKIATTDRSLNVRPTLSTVYVVSTKITEKTGWLYLYLYLFCQKQYCAYVDNADCGVNPFKCNGNNSSHTLYSRLLSIYKIVRMSNSWLFTISDLALIDIRQLSLVH